MHLGERMFLVVGNDVTGGAAAAHYFEYYLCVLCFFYLDEVKRSVSTLAHKLG